MSRTYKKETYVREVFDKLSCDRCKKNIPAEDFIESQETYTIRFMGGYGSKFGDGDTIECDLCQDCLMELIGKYYRVVDD